MSCKCPDIMILIAIEQVEESVISSNVSKSSNDK